MNTTKLPIAETFFSIQGEGPTQGVPSLFLRLGGCNLNCGGENSSWECDSKLQWTNSKNQNIDSIINLWIENGFYSLLMNKAHLVITGGEPLLYQSHLVNFIKELNIPDLFIEVETNGTISVNKDLVPFVTQFNISPKLKNSGQSLKKRLVPCALVDFSRKFKERSIFKFVISSQEDWDEVYNDFVIPFDINHEKIWLMPSACNKKELDLKSKIVSKICIEKNINFSNRLQVQIWDKTTGV